MTCGIRIAGRRFRWLLALAAGLCACPGCDETGYTTKVSGANIGKDPQAFKTAEELYKTAKADAYDARAAALAKALTDEFAGRVAPQAGAEQVQVAAGGAEAKIGTVVIAHLREGDVYTVSDRKGEWVCIDVLVDGVIRRPWVSKSRLVSTAAPSASSANFWWQRLRALNPYRAAAEVQGAVPQWAEACAQRLRGKPADGSKAQLDEANRHYKEGRFADAAAKYREFLGTAPAHLDARNNLALVEMHLGNDLVAQVDLEALRRLEPAYTPAAINLTVVYERTGLGAKARTLAQETAQKRKDVPAAVYNAAWFATLDQKHDKAGELLDPLIELKVNPEHKQLRELAQKQAGAAVSGDFLYAGLAGVCGGKGSAGGIVVALVIFAIGAILAMVGAVAIGQQHYSGAAARAFKAFLAIGSVWYLGYWGLPLGGWWALFGAYALAGGGIAASAAEKR